MGVLLCDTPQLAPITSLIRKLRPTDRLPPEVDAVYDHGVHLWVLLKKPITVGTRVLREYHIPIDHNFVYRIR